VYRSVLLPPGLNSIAVNKYIILYIVIIIAVYYLEGFQCLTVSSSESVPRREPPRGRLHKKHSAVIADTWAARRDAKPRTIQVKGAAYSTVACRKRDSVKGKGTVLPVTYHVGTEKGRVITLSNSAAFIALKECTPSVRVYMLLPFSGQKWLR
jgi:hypothetical protein